MPPTIYESPKGCVRRRVAFHRRSRRGSADEHFSIFRTPRGTHLVPRFPYPRPTPRHPADLDVARIAPPDRSDTKKDRRLSSFSIFNAGYSLLKSLGKSASKRKRGANADEDLEEDDDSAGKRTRGATGYAQGPGSAFITSSVRKSKGESSPSSSRYDRSVTRITPALDARGVARSANSNPKVDRSSTPPTAGPKAPTSTGDEVARNLAFDGDDDEGGSRKGKVKKGAVKEKTKRTGTGSIFSPFFSFFSPSKSSKAANTAKAQDASNRGGASGRSVRASTRAATTGAPAPSSKSVRTRPAPKPVGAGGGASPPQPPVLSKDSDSEDISDAEPVRISDNDDDGDDARSLESDEAEEMESDGAVLAASSRGGGEPRGDVVGVSGAGKGTLRDGFGKWTESFVDDEYTYEDELDDEEYDEEFDPWVFIHGLPPLSSCVRANRPAILPRKSPVHKNKNTLVLDLDETLVHSNLEQTIEEADFSFPVTFNGQQHIVNVRRRPYLVEFMEFAARHFEVVVFTASQRVYAERLLNKIDPNQVLIKHRLYRESCVLVEGNYMKDLSVLGRDLAKTIIVDNSPQAFGFQVDNGVPIESWFDDQSDRQLLKLMPLLARLAQAQDVRPVLRKKFALEERIERAGERTSVLNSMGSPRR